jgi:ABC-type uncharacterized transport system fused permease/ATPase subunit
MMSLKRVPTNMKVRNIKISVIRSVLVNLIKISWRKNLNRKLWDWLQERSLKESEKILTI